MIMEIISKVNEFKDLMNLLLVPRIREFVFKTPKCMRKIKIVFQKHIHQEDIAQFLKEKGEFLRIVVIFRNCKEPILVPYTLNQTPNLEEFVYEHDEKSLLEVMKCDEIVDCSFELPLLKSLKLVGEVWLNFISNAKHIENLEILKLKRFSCKFNDTLTRFLCDQKNLKELSIENAREGFSESTLKSFPSWDISSEIKFKLTRFEYFNSPSENLYKFVESQSKDLQELLLNDFLSPQLCDLIFKKCKNLVKLTLFSSTKFPLQIFDFSEWILNDLKCFQTTLSVRDGFNLFQKIFPNLKSLKCEFFKHPVGIFENLEILDVYSYFNIRNIEMPNLKTLFVRRMTMLYESIVLRAPNLEIIEVEATNLYVLIKIIRDLKKLEKLQVFRARSNSRHGNGKIWIDISKKIVKSSSIYHKNVPLCIVLNKFYKNYSIIFDDDLKVDFLMDKEIKF